MQALITTERMTKMQITAKRFFGAMSNWLDTVLIAIGTGVIASVILALAVLLLTATASANEPDSDQACRAITLAGCAY